MPNRLAQLTTGMRPMKNPAEEPLDGERIGAEEADEQQPKPRVQSVARAMSILFAVAQSRDGLGVSEIRRRTGLPLQATYHLLHTLQALGLLRRGMENRFLLGLHVGDLIDGFNMQFSCPDELRGLVKKIAEKSGETSYVSGWLDGDLITLAVEAGTNPIQASGGASRRRGGDIHARASGKLLLAIASEDEREKFIRTCKFVPRTANTIPNAEAFRREIRKIQSDGYALDDEEYAEGLRCVAVPFRIAGENYAVCVSAPSDRFTANFAQILELLQSLSRSMKLPTFA